MRIDSPKVSNLTFQSGSGVSDSSMTGSFSGSFTGVGNFTGLTADSVEYANILNRPNGLVSGSSAQARAQIGSVIGTDVQAYHENLNDISNLNPTDSTFIVGAGSSFVLESGNTVRTSLGLGSLAVLDTNSTLSNINLSGNTSYSFANLTNQPTLFSGSDQVTGLANNQLTNSSISVDGTAISLGGSVTTLQLGATNTTALAGNTRTITSGEITNISDNNAKVTNVTTNLSITGTSGARTIVSSDGTNAIIPIATTSVSGLLSPGLFDEIDANTAKVTFPGLGTTSSTALAGDTTTISGAQASAITANTAKETNVSTDLSKTVSGTGFSINSSDGNNVALTLATTDNWGIMSDEMFDKLDGIETGATADQSLTDLGLQNVTNESKATMFTSPTFTGTIAIPNIADLESAVAANTAKATDVNHNVTTNLSITGTTGARTIVSSDGTNAIIPAATDSVSGVMSSTDHTKLTGIEASATADQTNEEIVAAVVASTSISNSNKGTIRSNIGVDSAGTDNSTDVTLGGSYNYITLTGQAITRNQIDLSTDVTGTLPVGNMAATALTTVQTAANQTAHLALTAQEGDVVVRSDENKTYMHNGGSAGSMADFTLLATPTDAVTSVDGNTGVVTTLQIGTSGTTAMAGNTTFAFADITSKPTTISGYGITDALALGTTSTTALAGNTTSFGGNAATVTLGTSTGPQTINIQTGNTVSGQNAYINIGTGGSSGSSKTINIGTTSTSYHTKNINMGNSSVSSGTQSNITMYGTVLMDDATVAATHTIGGTTQTGTITLGRSTQTQTINIGTGLVANSRTKTINIGTNNATGSTTNINIGPTSSTATRAIAINGNTTLTGNLTVDGTTQFDHMLTLKSDASTSGVYDQLVSIQAKGTSTTWYEAARIATLGSGSAPSRMIIGQDNAAMTFFDGFGSRYIYPAHADTGVATNGVCDLGSYSARWKLGRFSSGTTTSSDRNEKRDIEELTAAELRVAVRCKPLLRKYRRIDAYEEKGEAARIHFGIIAQDLDDAFTAEGLDAHRYAMFMEDTWYEYEGGVVSYPTLEDMPEEHRASATEHTAQGVRYEQLLAFMIAAL